MKLIVFVAAVWTLIYLAACWVWPFTRCLWCEGTGRHMSPWRKGWRDCRRCRGSGRRLRLGRWPINWVIRQARR